MTLLTSWRDSLTVFKPANLKLFSLVTLKAFVETYKVWLKYCGWLIVLLMMLQYYSSPMPQVYTIVYPVIGAEYLYSYCLTPRLLADFMLLTIVLTLLYLSLFLSTRASVALKNARYFLSYFRHFVYLMIWFLLLPFIYELILPGLVKGITSPIVALFTVGLLVIYHIIMAPITCFFILFLLDSDGSPAGAFKSLWRSIKMVLYNMPFCIVITLLSFLLLMAIKYPVYLLLWSLPQGYEGISSICSITIILLWLSLVACIMTNFYIKRVHEQFKLYFS